MTERARALLAEFLKLTLPERAAWIAEAATYVDEEEGTFAPEWRAEIERRAQEAHRERTGATLDEVEARLAERLRRG